MAEKTHWKKNADGTYISGEDMKFSLNGLSPEMNVYLTRFEDGETYDQNQNKKSIKTVMHFKTLEGVELHKGVLLNKTNALVFKAITNSPFVDDWVEVPITMLAKADVRHGFVVRFQPYKMSKDIKDQVDLIKATKTLPELEELYKGFSNKTHLIIKKSTAEQKTKLS